MTTANAGSGETTTLLPPVIEDAVTPRSTDARERATDLMKATVPLPLMIGLIASAVTIAAAMWRIESQMDLITQRVAHNREMMDLREKALEDRFKTLEAKIEAAGLRNFNMSLVQELQQLQQKAQDQKGR